jgi:membrane-bound lytic murein transglycosylase D
MRQTLLTALLLAAPSAWAEPPAAGAAAAAAATATVAPTAPSTAAPTPAAASNPTAAPPATSTPNPTATATEPTADAPETGPQAGQIDDQSRELEAIREAERTTRVQEAPSLEARAAEAAETFGLGSPLGDRIEGALRRDVTPPPSEAQGRIPLIPELDHDLERLQAEYDIPVDVNEAVVSYIRFFQSPLVRPHFVKWLGRSHRYLDRYRQILHEEGLPEDTVYLAMIESGFANFAQSRARAVGPWQFIAPTGRLFGLKQDFWVDERRDPEKSARAAARYLKELREQTGDWRLAWAGYNAGAGTVLRAVSKGYPDFWSMAATKGRRILRAETKGYVPKLMAAAIVSKHPEAFGFRPEEIEPERWPDFVAVPIPDAAPLAAIARAAEVPEQTLLDLNPELRRACTPPRPYELKLPREAVEKFATAWPQTAPRGKTTFDGHVVRRGETLGAIAARYGVPLQGLLEMNPGVSAQHLRIGAELIIPKAADGVPAVVATRPAPAAVPAPAPAQAPAAPATAAPTVAAPPAAAQARAAVERSGVWKVRPGDTLWSIARENGVPLQELCRLNGIANPGHHKLKVGAELVLAAGRG